MSNISTPEPGGLMRWLAAYVCDPGSGRGWRCWSDSSAKRKKPGL